jgi:hypothetical protein
MSFDFDWSVVRLCDFKLADSRPFETQCGFSYTKNALIAFSKAKPLRRNTDLSIPLVCWRMVLFASTFVVVEE